MARRQGIFWIGTAKHSDFPDGWTELPPTTTWLKGQLEIGTGGYVHWQFIVAFDTKKSIIQFRAIFGDTHGELTRSDAAEKYVWKQLTAVPGTQFELGAKPIQRNNPTDWQSVWDNACIGALLAIPPSVRVCSYRTLKQIMLDYQRPLPIERRVVVYWGQTGSGKTRRAWDEAGMDAFVKVPTTKFWDGYQGQENVIIDEFRGRVDISHLLTWLDRYPVPLELKHGGCASFIKNVWITSNLHPREWYPELDTGTFGALERRFSVIEEMNVVA